MSSPSPQTATNTSSAQRPMVAQAAPIQAAPMQAKQSTQPLPVDAYGNLNLGGGDYGGGPTAEGGAVNYAQTPGVQPTQDTPTEGLLTIQQPQQNQQQNLPDYQAMARQNMLQGQMRVSNALNNNPMGSVRPWFTQPQQTQANVNNWSNPGFINPQSNGWSIPEFQSSPWFNQTVDRPTKSNGG
jgi:hypothetical protein